MRRLVALAPGKVNLCLLVGRPRADGLHPLVSVVQAVSLADELSLEPLEGADRDVVECPGVPGENLAARALAAFRAAGAPESPSWRLHIAKRVPVAAGMGGGSADAAAALRLAAHAAGTPNPTGRLEEIAFALGADVPAQLAPGRALVTGAGEVVEPLAPAAGVAFVVVPAAAELSTAEVYRRADRLGTPRSEDELAELEARVRAAIAAGGSLPADLAVNDLEPAARSLLPAIDDALADVSAAGAERAMVSGSGPTVFGTFAGDDAPARAEEAAARLRARHPRACPAAPVEPSFGSVREAGA